MDEESKQPHPDQKSRVAPKDNRTAENATTKKRLPLPRNTEGDATKVYQLFPTYEPNRVNDVTDGEVESEILLKAIL